MERTALIEKAAKEFQRLTKRGDQTNRYSKDRNQKSKERIAVKVAKKYEIKENFFKVLVASANF